MCYCSNDCFQFLNPHKYHVWFKRDLAVAIGTWFLAKLIKLYDKMDPPIRIRIIYHVKHCPAIRLKFGYETFLTKLVLVAIASICSPVKETLPLHCRTFSGFAIICFNFTDSNNKVGLRSYYKEIPFKIENMKFLIEFLKIDF